MIIQKKMANGFAYIEIQNKNAKAKVALQGGHLFHYQLQGKKPLLWLSEASSFTRGKAIRGGIPLCWPWFGQHSSDPELPQHGFARTAAFELGETNEIDDGTTALTLHLHHSPATLALWPYKFDLRLDLVVGNTLSVALTTRNCDTTPFTVSSALHSYFAVSHIDRVVVQGLAGKHYFDALTGEMQHQEGDLNIQAEVDRVYEETGELLKLLDGKRRVSILPEGSQSTVVWNPWLEKSRRMADMNDDGYTTMLCIETANARQDARLLQPDAEQTLKVVLTEM